MLLALYPEAFRTARGSLFARAGGLYNLGDLSGTLFLVRRAMVGETGPYTVLLGYPGGASIRDDFPNPLLTEFLGFFGHHLGLPLGYNLGVALLLASNGLAVYLAVRLSGGRWFAALGAGAVATALPGLLDELLRGRPVTACWGPALAGMALCAASVRSRLHLGLALPGGALVGVGLILYPFAPLFLAPWAVLLALGELRRPAREALLRGCAALGLATIGAWPGLSAAREAAASRVRAAGLNPLRDLATLGEGLAPRQLLSGASGVESGSFFLLIFVAVAASALSWRWRWRWGPALLVAAGLMAIALGPDPLHSGETQVRAPYTLAMTHIPVLRGAPRPSRYALAGALLACVWLGQSLGAATRDRGRLGALGCLGLCGLLLLQLRPHQAAPAQSWPPLTLPGFLEEEPVLLDLPLVFDNPQAHLVQVALLPVPRLNPLPSQLPARVRAVREDPEPLCAALLAVHFGQEPAEPDVRAIRSGESLARSIGLRYVLLHQRAASAPTIRRWLGFLRRVGATERWRDRDLVIYALKPPDGMASAPAQ